MQGAVEDGDGVAGEVDAVPVDGGADQAGPGGCLQSGEAGVAEAGGPVGGQGGVGAAGDRVLGNACGRGEEAGDEVVAAARIGRWGGGDDPADAVAASQWGQRGEIGGQATDSCLVGEDREQIPKSAGAVGGVGLGFEDCVRSRGSIGGDRDPCQGALT